MKLFFSALAAGFLCVQSAFAFGAAQPTANVVEPKVVYDDIAARIQHGVDDPSGPEIPAIPLKGTEQNGIPCQVTATIFPFLTDVEVNVTSQIDPVRGKTFSFNQYITQYESNPTRITAESWMPSTSALDPAYYSELDVRFDGTGKVHSISVDGLNCIMNGAGADVGLAAADDTAVCKMAAVTITGTYDAKTGKATYTDARGSQVVDSETAVSYHLFDRVEFLKDQTLVNSAQKLKLNADQVVSVAVFLLQQDSDGTMSLLKFNGVGGAVLKTALTVNTQSGNSDLSACD